MGIPYHLWQKPQWYARTSAAIKFRSAALNPNCRSSLGTKMPAATPREDLHQRITNQIIAAIEAGAGACRMPWNPKLCTGGAARLPHNPVGNYAYHGINILTLWGSQ